MQESTFKFYKEQVHHYNHVVQLLIQVTAPEGSCLY